MWFKIIRPGTLLATIIPVFLGIVLANYYFEINTAVAILTMVTAVLIQILSNLVNDFYDYKRGNDAEGRLGPERAVSTGLITERQLLHAIALVVGLALLGGVALIWIGGWPIFLIGVSALLFAWLYSATSKSLSTLGIADLFVLIYFGPIATAGTFYLQTGFMSWPAFWLGVGSGLISMGVLTVNNVRDYEQDKQNGKKTIVVRFGLRFGKLYYLLLLLLPLLPLIFFTPHPVIAIYLLAAVALYALFLRAKGKAYNKILVYTGFLNLIYLLTFCLALFN